MSHLPTTHHLAANLRRLRTNRGLTQDELAQMSDLSAQLVSNIERGFRANPNLATLTRLARSLDISVARLLGGESAEPGSPDQQETHSNGEETGQA